MAVVVRRLMAQAAPPTALILANSHWFLAALTALAQRGPSVPEHVSLISRDDDPFLDYVVPAPAR